MPSIASSLKQSRPIGVDPRIKRYGFFPGLFIAEMESAVSGQQERVFPQGELIAFESADLEVTNFEIMKSNWTPTKMENITAEWFISNVKKTYGSQGFVECDALTGVGDDEVEHLFNLVHPSFTSIAHTCPQGLTKTCAKCRIDMLQSAKYEDEAADKLRLQLLYAYTTYHDHARNRWAEIVGDVGKGLGTIGDGEEHYRKNVHETALAERAIAAADAMGQRQAAATVAGMREVAEAMKGGDMTAVLAQIAETQRQQGEILAQLVNQNAITATTTEASKIDKRTREYRESQKNESTTPTGD